jgi:tetratricopeptide (TPR) repeat protein
VRITAQLIDAGSDTHLWSETYDRDLADIFAVQEEIARAIVDRLPVQLAGGRRLTTDPDATVDPQAYTLYLQGRHFWIRREIPEAIEYFQQAVKVDPDFARAHAALAESYVLLPVIEGHQPEEAFALVEESAQRALALNENLAAAHAARALMLNYRMRWDEADLAFRKALALNDSDPFTLTWHCIYLATVNAIQEALRQCERARALDPAYAPANASLANVLVHLGRNREAEVLYRLSLRLIPGYGLAYQGLINLAIVEERIADAVALAELSLVAGHQARPHLRAVVAYAFAMAGMEVRAREILTQLLAESSAGKFIDPVDLAFVRLGLQDYEGALAEFTKLLASPMSFMGTLVWNPRTHPAFNPLRGDPRFQAVLAQLYPP